ncbi:anthranilate synthase family protein [Streptomyces sp. SID10853]|uniref:anthranilate synthase family protein n=1 Tax=Streptomyces sp. SID10853 TaxID=2706028 RepID=UPI0031BA919C
MTGTEDTDPLARVLTGKPPPFALLHRPGSADRDTLDVLFGEVSTPATLAEVPLPEPSARPGAPRHDVLVLVPYRQITERGFRCADDGAPLIAMTVGDQATVAVTDVLARIPDTAIELAGGHFDVDDDTYADTVRRVIADEIGQGAGANFVLKRSFVADITGYTPRSALTLFRRLLVGESGAYWTFIVHTGTRTFVGATPECHVGLRDGTAVMNPISGTYRYPPSGPTLPGVLEFLSDRKEADELYMVVDEELKMMARICATGGRVTGPRLKEMARLAHTEYVIEGRSTKDPREILRETMFAPTVTGSPLENACRVIHAYEPEGRGYYSGVVALIGQDAAGARALDSAILIRTADIGQEGRVRISVGATLVRHSDPASEVAETRAKAAGLLAALQADAPVSLAQHPRVRAALEERNATIAGYWLADADAHADACAAAAAARDAGGDPDGRTPQVLDGAPGERREVLVIDAEDTFTAMLAHQLRSVGLSVTVRRFDEPYAFDGWDLVIMGPGPGSPHDSGHPKIAHLRSAVRTLLAERRPFIAVCLSHQLLSRELGFDVIRRDTPNQGVQREIDFFGARERVGFYNTFAAVSSHDKVDCGAAGMVEVSRDTATGEVYGLRGAHFASMQFHAESLLTQHGVRILERLMAEVAQVTDSGPVSVRGAERAVSSSASSSADSPDPNPPVVQPQSKPRKS